MKAELEAKIIEIINAVNPFESFDEAAKEIASLFEPYIKLIKKQDLLLDIIKNNKHLSQPQVYWEKKNELIKEIAELKKQLK